MIGISPLPTVIGLATVMGDQGPGGPRAFYFGCNSGVYTTNPVYYYPFSTDFNVSTSVIEIENNVAGYLKNLFVRTAANACDGDTTFVVYVNGASTLLSVALILGSTAIVSNTSDQVTVAAGDKISVRSTRPGTYGVGLGKTYATFERTAT